MKGERLDERVVREGLAASRNEANARIRAGEIWVGDRRLDKPGTRVPVDAIVRLESRSRRFVSRGGEKLRGALDALSIDPSARVCLDVGASTGGFSDCLLQAGARRIVAVDVGYGQLDARLRGDERVVVRERTNARSLTAADLPEAVTLVTIDVSFISVRLLLPALSEVAPAAELLVLVKPQFEVGRDRVGKGGVVRDDALREGAADAVARAAAAYGWREAGRVDSRVHGPKGNREIFLWLQPASVDGSSEPTAGRT